MRWSVSLLVVAVLAVSAPAQELTHGHRLCFGTQRSVAGAVEMYNLDSNQNVTQIPWEVLVAQGYLQVLPEDPGQGAGSHRNYQLDSHEGIACQVHGTPAAPRVARPGPGAPAGEQQRQECHDTQRTIAGAVAMFNSDNNVSVSTIPWTRLLEEGYLHSIPQDPGQGAGSARHYQLRGDAPNGVTCSVHGPSPASFTPLDLRRCFATQRLLAGAVELYNLDHNLAVVEIPWKPLVQEGYLARLPVDAGGPPGSHVRYQLTGAGGGLRCSRHGQEGQWESLPGAAPGGASDSPGGVLGVGN